MCEIPKKILGLDLGTNSIGWALINHNFIEKQGNIQGIGSRIIPMTQDILGKFDSGVSISQTAERTAYRGVRRLYQRDNLRRERLHRVLNVLNFLPPNYAQQIDFTKRLGQFKTEVKLDYVQDKHGKSKFIFMDSFQEMIKEFKIYHPELFYTKSNGTETKIPLDWTLYYLRKKALTKKISKEELAWILLNFNQKRGYYQLRGEEEEEQKNKNTTFETLKVSKVTDSGEKITKSHEILYDIFFENGWQYSKQTTKPENWLNKTKEFIVTTSTLKDGTTKRSYKAVDSEVDWIAIKKKTEQLVEASQMTVGEYIYQTLLKNPTQKIRGKLIKTIERKFYKQELNSILDKQVELHKELQDKDFYQACIEELYPRNAAHKQNIKDKDFKYLFVDDIIFYQRPLKSKKSTISGCQYEYRTYYKVNEITGEKEKITQALKVVPKSHPLFIEFRMWQFLQNLKFYKTQNNKDIDVTDQFIQNEEEWCDLFDFLMDRKEVEQKNIIDYFVKNKRIAKLSKTNYRWNFQEDKKLPMNETKAQFISHFKKVEDFEMSRLTIDFQIALWHIIYSVTDKIEFEQALSTFAKKHDIDEVSFVSNFKKLPPYKAEYGSYSLKAIKKLLPLMRIGRYWKQEDIPEAAINQINDIKKRLESIDYNENVFKKSTDTNQPDVDLQKLFESIVDDATPKQLLKSFLPLKNKSHFAGLNTYQACYAVYRRHSEVGEITQWKTSSDIDLYLNNFKQHSLRNPIVEQVVTETLRTVRDIWNYYGQGKPGFFDEIHVELGRDMKNSASERERISKNNSDKERTNERIKELLVELKEDYNDTNIRPYSPSHQEILKIYEEGVYQNPEVRYDEVAEDEITKIRRNNNPTKSEIVRYKLWLEQGYISPYTGQIIPLSKLFSEDYQIEHIIPQSRYFDDSLANKVICESAVNQEKTNQTAYEFLKDKGGSIIDLGHGQNVSLLLLEDYESHCTKYFQKNRNKLRNLLSEDIPEGFIERQMNDSRYISKFIKGLLSNIVREDGEKEATSKNLLPTPGNVTSRLKQEWGLNNQWNEIVAPRFKRLNEITKTNDYGYWDNDINAFRTQIPKEYAKGFTKKRIDHRHHALDALVIASTTRNHTHYLSALNAENKNYSLRDKLLIKNNHDDYTQHFQMPWPSFNKDALDGLSKIVVSFKQNNRVINKTNNKTWQWVKNQDGQLKKELVKQTKGENWAIRKPLHKETISGVVKIKHLKKGLVNLSSYLEHPDLIVDKRIKTKVKSLQTLFDNDLKKIKKHLKNNPIKIGDSKVEKIQVYEFTKGATASRTTLNENFTAKQINAITDSGIRAILLKHLNNYLDVNGKPQYDLAFNSDGIEALNKNIVTLNNGKKHQPIYKVRLYEEGKKFPISENLNSSKSKKYVEAAKGTNLFFAIYRDEEKQKRNYDSVPLNEVIEYQKEVANSPKEERNPILPKEELGKFLFTLSPNDLVYVPTQEEQENPNGIDFNQLNTEQIKRIYKMVSSSGNQCFFIQSHVAQSIVNKIEYSALNKMEKDIEGTMIKSICWKLETDRLGHILKVIR